MRSLIQVFFVIPITIYTFFRGVYDFGPKSRKRTLFDILLNPVPGIDFWGDLVKQMTLMLFDIGDSIITSLLIELQETEDWMRNEIRKALHRQFTIVQSLISTPLHKNSMGINHILHWMMIRWAREGLRESIACQWCFTLLFAIFHVLILCSRCYQECHLRESSQRSWSEQLLRWSLDE